MIPPRFRLDAASSLLVGNALLAVAVGALVALLGAGVALGALVEAGAALLDAARGRAS